MSHKPRVLVLGGGFAALESAFLLRMRLRDQVDLTLVSDNASFVFRPNSIYVPFGADPDSLLVDLAKPTAPPRRSPSTTRGSPASTPASAGSSSLTAASSTTTS